MNTMIKEIALKVGGSHYPEVGGIYVEQFAKEIAKECIRTIQSDSSNNNNDEYHYGKMDSIFAIKKKFDLE